jgi:hypothetical protein
MENQIPDWFLRICEALQHFVAFIFQIPLLLLQVSAVYYYLSSFHIQFTTTVNLPEFLRFFFLNNKFLVYMSHGTHFFYSIKCGYLVGTQKYLLIYISTVVEPERKDICPIWFRPPHHTAFIIYQKSNSQSASCYIDYDF